MGSVGLYLGLAVLLALIAFAWWFIRWAKRSGWDELRADTAEKGVADARKANEARAGVDRLPDGAAADRLRNDWSR